jgi:hypothetical protein
MAAPLSAAAVRHHDLVYREQLPQRQASSLDRANSMLSHASQIAHTQSLSHCGHGKVTASASA